MGMTPEEGSKDSGQGMRLTAEPGSQMMLQFEGIEDRLKSILVGLEPSSYLIIRAPLFVDRSMLQEGKPVIVRYVYCGSVYGFRTSIISSIRRPFPLLFLAYPGSVEKFNLRKKVRVSCHIPGAMTFNSENLAGLILDISESGCRFVGKAPKVEAAVQVAAGDEIEISFPLLGLEGLQIFRAKARTISQDRETISVGMEFLEMEPEMSNRIVQYVESVSDYDVSGTQ